MSSINLNKKDEITMRLVHYFVTEKNYSPMIVNGVKNEIWLENPEGPYKIIRINSNYIHNAEQFKYDVSKIKNVMNQIKRKTVALSMNTLNILLDTNDLVEMNQQKNVDSYKIYEIEDVINSEFISIFPELKEKMLVELDGMDLLLNVTKDINEKTEKENKIYEETFKEKPILITYIIMAICTVMFFISMIMSGADMNVYTLLDLGASYAPFIKEGQLFRLITHAFLHADIIHFLVNMYSLYIIGSQVENLLGRKKFTAIYLVSAITGCLLSAGFDNNVAVGASGAIFGLLGAFLYFGYHYRLYLGSVLRSQIIPTIILNLMLGFMMPNIDNLAHIGGLIGGYLICMTLGIKGKTKTNESINGLIALLAYISFLIYFLFFR